LPHNSCVIGSSKDYFLVFYGDYVKNNKGDFNFTILLTFEGLKNNSLTFYKVFTLFLGFYKAI